jgi:hypothetical protein
MVECLPDADRALFQVRLAALKLPVLDDPAIPGDLIAALTSGDRKAGDSLHLVVMDAHRAINQLQAATAVETVAGARVHCLSEQGRRRVEAFMEGVNRTAPLKFDHPGLGTTATEHNGRLLIQNDIGTTDAHVLVVRVDGVQATLTYTDIHDAPAEILHWPARSVPAGLGGRRAAPQRQAVRRAISARHRPLRRVERGRARPFPRPSGVAHRVPDRLEPHAKAAAWFRQQVACDRCAQMGSRP